MKFRLFLKSYKRSLIKTALRKLSLFIRLQSLKDCILHKIVVMPLKIKKFCVLRSPHVNKNSQEHFEIRYYKLFLEFEVQTPASLNVLLNCELPEGLLCILKLL